VLIVLLRVHRRKDGRTAVVQAIQPPCSYWPGAAMRRERGGNTIVSSLTQTTLKPAIAAIKSEEQQACGMVFRTRDLLVRQRTQLINAIRCHLAEFGWVAPKGPSHVTVLTSLLDEEEELCLMRLKRCSR